jgi:cysteine desulfurase
MSESRRTYLDHNATSPLRPEVAEAMVRAHLLPGNASSIHAEGRAARAAIEAARDKVAALVGGKAKHVVFTSGGTEANNTVLTPGFRRAGHEGPVRLVLGSMEHPSVLEGHRFPLDAVEHIPALPDGTVDLPWLRERLFLGAGQPALVSLQAANNETGVEQPVAEAVRVVREHRGFCHCDAVQAAGRIPLDMGALDLDAVTLSAHKIGGPKGAGAIVLAEGVEIADRLMRGGGQERGSRAGTENVAAIVGFGVAAELARRDQVNTAARLRSLRDEAERHLRAVAADAVVFGSGAERLPNTLAFAIPGLRAETALIAFDLEGVAVSSGSACSSGKVKRSHVLSAMGVDPMVAEGAIRVSFGWNSTKEDVMRFARTCEKVVATLYKRRANAA